jgi:hypothetical protein
MPDPIAAQQLVTLARQLERQLARRRKLVAQLDALNTAILETRRFLNGVMSDDAPAPAPTSLLPGEPR